MMMMMISHSNNKTQCKNNNLALTIDIMKVIKMISLKKITKIKTTTIDSNKNRTTF